MTKLAYHSPGPVLDRWVALCAVAETVGMTAAASAATAARSLTHGSTAASAVALALALVVAGGLVEGTALGLAQARGLSAWLPRRQRVRWIIVTVVVAGLGWAAASAPSAMAGDSGAEQAPPLLLVLAGAAALGMTMGAVLGAAQASVLRGSVTHPWRWVVANVVAWAVAMPVIFLGASAPSADWSAAAVVADGAVTGLVAGAVLGLVSGWFLPSLIGTPVHNRVVLAVLASPAHSALSRSTLGLRVRGVVSDRVFALPVMYAADVDGLVVVPGHPEAKRWWRNLRRPADVSVLVDGTWRPGTGVVLEPGDPGYDGAVATYLRRWPRMGIEGGPLVRVVPNPTR